MRRFPNRRRIHELPMPTAPAGESHQRAAPGMSLERKLPIMMTGVLAAILAVSLWLTHRTLTAAAERSASEHLERAAGQVAVILENGIGARADILERWADDDSLRRAILGGDGTELHAALAALGPASDTGITLEIRDADRRRLAFVGRDAGETLLPYLPLEMPVGDGRAADSLTAAFGPIHGLGDRIYFWASAPVAHEGRVIGWIAQRRQVTGSAQTSSAIAELVGQEIDFLVRNASDDFWLRSPAEIALPPLSRDSTANGLVHERRRTGTTLAGEARVEGTPWFVVLETPLSVVHAEPHETLFSLALLSLGLVVIGAVVSWAISRRITRPLVSLTVAAEAIARGDYGRRVAIAGEPEVARLATAFNQMATQVAESREELEERIVDAERANRAKSDFLAVMSHELRTPLNAIGGYAQLLELGIYGSLTAPQLDALSRLSRSQSHLLTLINDVLNFVRIDAGQVQYQIVDVSLADTLANIEPLIAPQVEAKGLSFALHPCPPDVTVRADRDKLLQVLLNLLTNAVKFTDAGGRIAVLCDSDLEVIRIEVRDTGIGIPADRLDSIFEPFVQLDRALNRPHEGVGLGLAISRDLARGMGGDLTATSDGDHGATFMVTLLAGARDGANGEDGAPTTDVTRAALATGD